MTVEIAVPPDLTISVAPLESIVPLAVPPLTNWSARKPNTVEEIAVPPAMTVTLVWSPTRRSLLVTPAPMIRLVPLVEAGAGVGGGGAVADRPRGEVARAGPAEAGERGAVGPGFVELEGPARRAEGHDARRTGAALHVEEAAAHGRAAQGSARQHEVEPAAARDQVGSTSAGEDEGIAAAYSLAAAGCAA